ncbi:Uncharacterized protein APZ42_007282 [Daphnia magna]|uniref:Uncharacterized protein n=1 Tax=Daphnia magna TaxID=35525 RepID=A0A164FDZ3_9CRUS|nr:Uncharacterized protein APZ42_007282 [Daphnia magna]
MRTIIVVRRLTPETAVSELLTIQENINLFLDYRNFNFRFTSGFKMPNNSLMVGLSARRFTFSHHFPRQRPIHKAMGDRSYS